MSERLDPMRAYPKAVNNEIIFRVGFCLAILTLLIDMAIGFMAHMLGSAGLAIASALFHRWAEQWRAIADDLKRRGALEKSGQ